MFVIGQISKKGNFGRLQLLSWKIEIKTECLEFEFHYIFIRITTKGNGLRLNGSCFPEGDSPTDHHHISADYQQNISAFASPKTADAESKKIYIQNLARNLYLLAVSWAIEWLENLQEHHEELYEVNTRGWASAQKKKAKECQIYSIAQPRSYFLR